MTASTTSDNDIYTYLFAGAFILPALPALAGTLFTPAQTWLIQHHILTTENVLIPIGQGAGIDLLRAIILAAFLALILLGTIHGARRARARRQNERSAR